MKKFMKLIPAFVMLLVSAILVSTATYAWFSMNTQVTATGMEVKARSSEALAISADGTHYSNTMTLATNASALYPVSLVDNASDVIGNISTDDKDASTNSTTGLSYYIIDYTENKVNDPNNYAAVVPLATYLADTTTYADNFKTDSSNFVTDDLWLKYTAESGNKEVNLVITVSHEAIDAVAVDVPYASYTEYNTINGTTLTSSEYDALPAASKIKTPAGTYNTVADYNRDMENAFHFAFLNVDTTKVWNYDVTDFTDTDTDSDGVYDSYVLSVSAFVTLTANTPVHYTVYGWYEGEDADCTTANAISVTDLVVDLEFTLVP